MKRGLVALLILMLVSTGCYWNSPVGEYEIGLHLAEGARVSKVLPPGRHSGGGWFTKMATVDVSAITGTWEDSELVTRDKQPVGFSVFYAVARKRDEESVKGMWSRYNREATDDEAFIILVEGKLPRVIKAVTTKYKLDQMLGVEDLAPSEQLEELVNTYGRQVIEAEMATLYEQELAEVYVELLDIGINNIAPDAAYMEALKKKALQQINTELAVETTKQLEEQVLQEVAQTAVDLEIASRTNLVAQEKARVYETNPGWLKLQIWEAAKEVFAGDNVWFIDPNADVTLLFSGENQAGVIPVGP